MRKFLLSAIALTSIYSIAIGQTVQCFKHLDLGVTLGTTGIGIDLSTPIIKDYMNVRAGFSIMPTIKPTMHFNIESGKFDADGNWVPTKFESMADKLQEITGYKVDDQIDMKGESNFYNCKVMLDVTPFRNKRWHFTAGAYIGSSHVAKAYNTTEDMPSLFAVGMYNNIYDKIINDEPIYGDDFYFSPEIETKFRNLGRLGIHVGNYPDGKPYMMEPDKNSMVRANIIVSTVKPYLGFGYGGNLLKNDNKFKISFDCGALFWGGCPSITTHDGTNLASDVSGIKGKVGDYVEAIKIFKVYPVLDVRFSYSFF